VTREKTRREREARIEAGGEKEEKKQSWRAAAVAQNPCSERRGRR